MTTKTSTLPLERYQGLVRRIAYTLQSRSRLPASIELDDLVQAGMLGLMDAHEKYDASQGAAFETYASQRIRGAMLDTLRGRDWLPRSVRRAMRNIEHTVARLEQEKGCAVPEHEVCAAMDMSASTYQQLTQDAYSGQLLSFESERIGEEGAHYTCDDALLGDSPETFYAAVQQQQALSELIDALPVRERAVLIGYYHHDRSLKVLGNALGVSESRICQLRRRVERRLRQALLEQEQPCANRSSSTSTMASPSLTRSKASGLRSHSSISPLMAAKMHRESSSGVQDN